MAGKVRKVKGTGNRARKALVMIGASAAALTLAALSFGNAGGNPVAVADTNPDSPPQGVCSRFLAALKSSTSDRQVALDYGLPTSVPVPPGVTFDPVYCFGVDTEDGRSGEVLGFAAVDSASGDAWLVVARNSDMRDADWQAILTDQGWKPATKTTYGYTTRPDPRITVDLWSQPIP